MSSHLLGALGLLHAAVHLWNGLLLPISASIASVVVFWMEMLLMRLLCNQILLVIVGVGCLPHQLEFLLAFHFLLELDTLCGTECVAVLLFQLVQPLGCFGLDAPFLGDVGADSDLAFALDEALHVLLDEGPADDINDPGSSRLIFGQQTVNQVPQALAVRVWDRFLLVLDDLEDQTEQVFSVEGVLQRAELVQNASKRPNV